MSIRKKVVVGLSVMVMMGSMVGCVGKDNYGDEVVGKINNREIKRSEVMDTVLEKQIVTAYITDEVKKDFLSDIKVTPEEIEAQIEIYKMMIQGDWDVYLEEQMGGSEEFMRERVEIELKEGKKFEELKKGIEVTEEEITEEYEMNGDQYKHMTGKVIYTLTEDADLIARQSYEAGKGMSEILGDLDAAEAEYELKDAEYLPYGFEGFELPVSEYKVGDLVITKAGRELGETNFIYEIITKVETKADIQEEIESAIKEQKGNGVINEAFVEFIDKTDIEVLGKNLKEENQAEQKED